MDEKDGSPQVDQELQQGLPNLSGVARASALIAVSTAGARFISLASALAAAAIIGPRELGSFGFVAATAGVLGALGALGLAPLTTRAVAASTNMDAVRSLVWFAAFGCACLLIVTNVLFAASTDPTIGFVHLQALDTSTDVIVTAIWSLGLGMNPLLVGVLAGLRDFGAVTGLTATRAVSVALGTIAGARYGGGASATAAGAAAGETVALMLGGALLWRRGILRPTRLRVSEHMGMIGGAAASGAASILIQASLWGAQLLLMKSDHGAEQNGGFLVASRLALVVSFIPNAVSTAVLPHLASVEPGSAVQADLMRRTFLRVVLLAFAVALPLAMAADLTVWVLGSEFRQFSGTAVLMCLTGVVVAINNILGSMAVAGRRIRLWVASDVLLATGLVVASVPLVRVWGAFGLAVAHSIGYSLSVVLLCNILRSRAAEASSSECSEI